MFAQIEGQVLTEEDKPISSCNVYLSGYSIGTTTDSFGFFELGDLPNGVYELVFSHIAYKKHIEVIEIKEGKKTLIKTILEEEVTNLDEFVVKSGNNREWERNLKTFQNFFFGHGFNSQEIKITNTEALNFESDGSNLQTTNKPTLYISNEYLGYEITYNLESFFHSDKTKEILGYQKFVEQTTQDPAVERRWATNRQRSFNGSKRHFLKSLLNNSLEEQGFEAYISPLNPEELDDADGFYSETMGMGAKVTPENFDMAINIDDTEIENIKRLSFGGVLDVLYYGETAYTGGVQRSQIMDLNSPIYVYTNGVIVNPSAVKLFGQMAHEGIYKLLPNDYVSNDTLDLSDFRERTKLLRSLSTFTESKIIEKVYLHTNRNDYYPGETMWIKAYLAAGPNHHPSPLSNNIYITLLDKNNKEISSTVLKSEEGFAHASIDFEDELEPGNYTLIGFSEWMKNYDQAYFFKKEIKINSTTQQDPEVEVEANQIDLQFLPESGHILAGVENRIAFRAIDNNGNPVNIDGTITSTISGEQTNFSTLHNGIGVLSLTPKKGESFTATVPQFNQSFDLPNVETKGVILKIDPFHSEEELKLTVHSTISQDLFFIGQTRGWLSYTANIDITNGTGEVIIPKSAFPDGINHITLFKANGTPLAERLFYSRRGQHLKIDIELDKDNYERRSRTTAKIKVTDAMGNPVEGNFSLSANNIYRSYIKNEKTNILAHLLLNSDLKGKIHEPAYYFNSPSLEKDKQLDLVMMTQGWTRFEWDNLEKLTHQEEEYAYKKGLTLSGTMVIANRKSFAKDGTVTFINNGAKEPQLLVTTSNNRGRFVFENTEISSKTSFLLQGKTKKGYDNVEFRIDSSLYTIPSIKAAEYYSIKDHQKLNSFTERATFITKDNKDFLNNTTLLDDVIVEADREDTKRKILSSFGEPTISLSMDGIIPPGSVSVVGVFDYLKGRFAGVRIYGSYPFIHVEIRSNKMDANEDSGYDPFKVQPVFYLNNIEVSIETLYSISVNDIERVEVFKGPDAAIFGANGGRGAMLFFTKTGFNALDNMTNNGVTGFVLDGYNKAKIFYEPIYDVNYSDSGVPDFRIALHWAPYVTTNELGTAEVSWFNSDDLDDEIVITVEGLGAFGNVGYGKSYYNIRSEQN